MRWSDVLSRSDIVGGDLETQEAGKVYRGPITGVRMSGKYVEICVEWIARLTNGRWVMSETHPVCINTEHTAPQDYGDLRVGFMMPGLGFGVIFPAGGSKLSRDKVEQ